MKWQKKGKGRRKRGSKWRKVQRRLRRRKK